MFKFIKSLVRKIIKQFTGVRLNFIQRLLKKNKKNNKINNGIGFIEFLDKDIYD